MMTQQVADEITRIGEVAADAVRVANKSAGPNDERAVAQGLQALTEAVLLGITVYIGLNP
jgi:hypothetical protein